MEGITTGVDFLDAQTGGFHRAKPYLAFGSSGTGKSILGLQFAAAGLARGEGALYVCREKADDLVQQGERLGLSLGSHLDDERLVLVEYDQDFEDIIARGGPEEVLEELSSQTDASRIQRVILDPVDPFFSSLDQESVLRSQLRAVTSHVERLGWTPLLLCDDTVVARHPYVLRVFSEVCWGLFELRRPEVGSDHHSLLIYKMRNANLAESRFEFRIGEGGIRAEGEILPAKRSSFARFLPSERRVPTPRLAPRSSPASLEQSPMLLDLDGESLELLPDADLEAMERAAARSRSSCASTPTTRRPRTLVVEEDGESREVIRTALGATQQLVEAADGIEALGLLAKMHPALVVLSTDTRRLNGIGLTRILRDHGARVPILGLTPIQAGASERARCLLAGAEDTLPKPIDASDLAERAAALLALGPCPPWPPIEPAAALRTLCPSRLSPEELEGRLVQVMERAREAEIPVSLLGYEFRFVSGAEEGRFVDHFVEGLSEHIRNDDALCRLSDRSLLAVLLDAEPDGARTVARRVHERMAVVADAFSGEGHVKPKALFRVLTVHPHLLEGELPPRHLVDRLFEQPSRVIEEDLADRPGEPMEKYPLLEAVFGSLCGSGRECVSPLDGQHYRIHTDREGVRSVEIGEFVYRTQDRQEESPEGFRARRGVRIVWVFPSDGPTPQARIEEGRVFRGKEA